MAEKSSDTDFHMDCVKCNGAMELSDDGLALECPYCGNREPLDPATLERLRAIDEKELAAEKERTRAELKKQQAEWKRKDEAKRKRRRVLRILAGIFFFLILLSVACSAIEDALYEREQEQRLNSSYDWPTSGLAQKIPQPKSTTGHISLNYSDSFDIEVPAGEGDYDEYLEECRKWGFTVDPVSGRTSYEAYNSEGYRLSVYNWSASGTMDISIDAPLEMSDIAWPSNGMGALLPAPPSLKGMIESEYASGFQAYVGGILPEAFSAYADACIAAGFNVDYRKRNDYFYGENADGAHLNLEYEGFNTMSIHLYAPEK